MTRSPTDRPHYRASVVEIVGAWLGIWTPRRDSYIPPVPKLRILLAVAALTVAIAGTAVLVNRGKERGAERDRREAAVAVARIRAQSAREQLPRRASFPGTATAGAATGELQARRNRIEHALEGAIVTDSQARFRHHALDSPVLSATCVPFVRPSLAHPPEPPLTAASGRYECLGVTNVIGPTPGTRGGEFGFPFWARVDFRHGSAVWCKVNPRPGERGIAGDVFVPLTPECDLLGHPRL
jgi:hypothetical protein